MHRGGLQQRKERQVRKGVYEVAGMLHGTYASLTSRFSADTMIVGCI
jgi:hypothetical protein